MQMKPPRYPTNIPIEEDDVSELGIMTMWSSPTIGKEDDQGPSGSFLDRCNYCRKILGAKDNIYMYRYVSLKANSLLQIKLSVYVIVFLRGF